MTIEIIIVLALVFGSVILFATERLPVDLVALMIMAVLLVSGIVSPEEGLSGFSNTATITVGAMFVLSAGLYKTGAINFIGRSMTRLSKHNFWFALLAIMITVGAISAFINNTAAVAIFLPIVVGTARATHISPSKLLLPLSFASMFGGVCTLIGTSTNILVSSVAEAHNQRAFTMFEFSSLGLVFFGVGILYMFFVGVRLIPNRRLEGDLTQTFGMGEYLTEVVLLPESDSVGNPLADAPLVRDLDIDVIGLYREKVPLMIPPKDIVLQANDILRVRCDVGKIRSLQQRRGVALKADMKWQDRDLESEQAVLVEAVIAPNSVLEGKSLKRMKFRQTFGATALAIRHHEKFIYERLGRMRLKAGDVLLIEVRRDHLEQLKQHQAFVIVSEIGLPEFRRKRILPAFLIIFGVVATAALNIFPIAVSAIAGIVLMIFTKCLTLEETYQAIEWSVIFLLAGVLTLGVALEKTGAAFLISDAIISVVGQWGPEALVSALFFLTMMLTSIMSNTATAALIAPIAIVSAESLGINPRPLLMAVTFAASLSFMTPVGYQTNILIYGPGQYEFKDFLRVGTPLNILFWLLATFLIPRLWPFH